MEILYSEKKGMPIVFKQILITATPETSTGNVPGYSPKLARLWSHDA